MKDYRFKVNLGGMIQILSEHLYSSPNVYIRELLQNGTDAIVNRQKTQPEFTEGQLQLTIVEGTSLVFKDNGVGLTEEEIHRFLAIIGETSKQELLNGELPSDYIGRFGIGLLSCFMVSDELRIHTHSISDDASYEWIGYPNGIYTLKKLAEQKTVGTSVFLTCKEGMEEYFTKAGILSLLHYYGMLLPFPVMVDDGTENQRINPVYLPWENRLSTREELLHFGRLMFQEQFLDCIILKSESGDVTGAAYILPYKVSTTAKQKHRIYLKNMLLTESGEHLLPNWAVFVRCIINATTLSPTASRESFYENHELEQTRDNLGICITDYLRSLAKQKDERFQRFLKIHDQSIKALALEQDDLYELFIDYLEFPTTRGMMTGYELRMCSEPLVYVSSLDKFKQLSQIFFARGKLLINAGYVYDEEILLRLPEFYEAEVLPVDEGEVETLFRDLSIAEEKASLLFLKKASDIMKFYHCDVELKNFQPANLPDFYYVNDQAKLYRDILEAKEKASNLFQNMLSSFAGEITESAYATLYFNYSNPIVRKMLTMEDDQMLESFVEILYVQALLIGGFPLHNDEMALMNRRLLMLMEGADFHV